MLLFSPLNERFKALAVGPKIYIEDRGLDLGIVLLGHDGLFGGVHAADRRTIALVAKIAGAHALNERDLLWWLLIRRPLNFSPSRAGGAQQALELWACEHIRITPEAVLARKPRVVRLKAWG